MSSSVLRNVIQPKAQTAPLEKTREETKDQRSSSQGSAELPKHESEDMELVLGVLVENAPVAMAMFDRGMRYILANRQWISEFGLQQVQPLVGKSQYEIFPGLHPGWRQVYERALQGHIVRSEHDSLNGPDGRHLVYRWEVRPWRKKRDAAVGGLMVTCEKFSAPSAAGEDAAKTTPSSETHESTTHVAKTPDPLDCSIPMLVLNAEGAILRANVAAAHLTLDKGIQEGTTCFWEVFGDGRDYSALRQHLNHWRWRRWRRLLPRVASSRARIPRRTLPLLHAGWFRRLPTKVRRILHASFCSWAFHRRQRWKV